MRKELKRFLNSKDKQKKSINKTMQSVKGKGNKTTEMRFCASLSANRIRGWEKNNTKVLGKPDILFPTKKIAIFLDGCFWHGCPTCGHIPKKNNQFWKLKIDLNRRHDNYISLSLTEQGFRVLRFWEHEIQNHLWNCISKVKTTLENT